MTTTTLETLAAELDALDPSQLAALDKKLKSGGRSLWAPNPGSQTEAYFSKADITGYGGEAGPGKTDLLIGLSLTSHRDSLILRKTNKEAKKLADRYADIIGNRKGLNSQDGVWRLPDGRSIDYGGCEHEDDKQKRKGDPHDLIGFDEVVDFTRSQFEFIIQWNRPRQEGTKQRCRVVATFNPPTRAIGLWVIEYWAPWLDPKHPNPAKSGEIRWYTTIEGKDTEVDGPGPHEIDGEQIMALSRTFIRGYLHENIALQDYDRVRASAPKDLRSAYRAGDFEAALADAPNQLIPSSWVRAAQGRWTDKPPEGVPMCSMGVDCTGGGDDPMVISCRYDGWFAPMIEVPAKDVPADRIGATSAGIIISHRRDGAYVGIDLGGGYGGSTYERLKENGIPVYGYKGATASTKRTQDRKHGFFNHRAASYWGFREALDPEQPGGSPIALPPDSKLVADLTAPTFEIGSRGIKLEDKESVVERLGRSPDRGDATVISWECGLRGLTAGERWRESTRRMASFVRGPKVVRGHENRKGIRR